MGLGAAFCVPGFRSGLEGWRPFARRCICCDVLLLRSVQENVSLGTNTFYQGLLKILSKRTV